tara:strand:+ start:569 stop:817 length:249 start_codon:yes stop_codon:yes gene_type:complete
MKNLLIVLLLFFSFNTISKEKKDNIKPLKVNKKVEKKGDYVIIRTETIFTKSQWKELKDQTKKNKSLLKKRDKSLSAVQKNL